MDILKTSAAEIVKKIRKKDLSCKEVTSAFVTQAKKLNGKTGAFIEINESKALERAEALDNNFEVEKILLGLPIAVKDNFCTKGDITTAASKFLKTFRSPYTASCIARLEDQGAIVIGKTNMDEFAMGSSNENSSFGVCKNPWDLARVPGGSSGGSAVVPAARMAPVAIGSDTGGSIRQPASFCGTVGIKPTYGSISRFGMIAFASSLDQAGPIANTVEDAATVLDVMIAGDIKDGTSVKRQQSSLVELEPISLKGKKIGVPTEYFSEGLGSGTRSVLQKQIDRFQTEGAEIVEISLPHTRFAISVYYLVSASEASSNLARFDGIRYGVRHESNDLEELYKLSRTEGFGEEVQRRILLGTFALSAGYHDAFYDKACKVRRLIAQDFINAFNNVDIIVGPVSPKTAFKIGEKLNDPMAMYLNDVLTTPSSLAGLPAMSLPVGLDDTGLPVGLQVISPAFAEETLLRFAKTFEQIADFNEVPSVSEI